MTNIAKSELSDIAMRITGQSMFRILDRAKELERTGQGLIHFEIGDSHLEMPSVIKEAAINSINAGHTHYGSSYGEQSLREAIQKATNEDLGFSPNLSQIAVTTGANALIFYLLSILVNPGEEVILADPSFVTYNSVLNMLGIRGSRVHVHHETNFHFSPIEVKKRITPKTRLIIINSPANPTGAVSSREDLEEIFALATAHNIYILSDEIYSTMVYRGRHYSPGALDQCQKRVIVINGFSKPFAMTGWRVGYAIGPEHIIEKVALLSQTIVSCVPPFLQDACVVALNNRHELSSQYSEEYQKLRDIACSELSSVKQFSFSKPDGAFYLMIDVSKTGMSGDEFAAFAMEHYSVVTCPGSGFGSGGRNYIRICYASTVESDLREGCHRLRQAAEDASHMYEY